MPLLSGTVIILLKYLFVTCTWKKYTTLLCEVVVLMWLEAWLPLFASEGPENRNSLDTVWVIGLIFIWFLRLVIKCETTAIIRLWSHSSLEDFVTRDKIVSCLMSVWWSWIENDSDIGLTNPDNGFLKKKKKKLLYWLIPLRVAPSDAKSCLLSMGALNTTMH